MQSHNDRYLEDIGRPCPEEDEDLIVGVPATEGERVIKDYNEQEEAPTERDTDKTNKGWGQTATTNDAHEYLVKELWQSFEKLIENTETDTNMKAINDELVHAEREETSLEAEVNNDKVYAEHHDGKEEFESVGQYTANNHYFMKIEHEEKSNKTVGESDRSMRIYDTNAVEEDDNEIERGQGDNRDDSETINIEVTHTHEVQRIEKDKLTPPHTQNGPKDWPEEIEEFRFRPTGNKASLNQMDLP